jgi:hypothetical protein
VRCPASGDPISGDVVDDVQEHSLVGKAKNSAYFERPSVQSRVWPLYLDSITNIY